MNNEWDEYAADWDEDPAAVEYADKAFTELKKLVPLEGLRVFDFGCGTGLLTERLSPLAKEIVALDGAEKMIEQLARKKLPNVTSIAAFLTRDLVRGKELLAEKFDLVVASSVCAFLPDYEGTLPVLNSLLKPQGTFVQWDWFSTEEGSGFGLTESTVKGALEKAGFDEIDISQPFTMKSSKGEMTVLMASAVNA